MPKTIESMKRRAPRFRDVIEHEEAQFEFEPKKLEVSTIEVPKDYGYETALDIVMNQGGETNDVEQMIRATYGQNPSSQHAYDISRIRRIYSDISSKNGKHDLPYLHIPAHTSEESMSMGLIFSPKNKDGRFESAGNFKISMNMERAGWTGSLLLNALKTENHFNHPDIIFLNREVSLVQVPIARTFNDPSSESGVEVLTSVKDQLYLGATAISEYYRHTNGYDRRIDWLLTYTSKNDQMFDPARA